MPMDAVTVAMAVSLLLLSIGFCMGRAYEKHLNKCREKDEDEQILPPTSELHDIGSVKKDEAEQILPPTSELHDIGSVKAEFFMAPNGAVLHLSERCSYLSRTRTSMRMRLCHRCVKKSEQH